MAGCISAVCCEGRASGWRSTRDRSAADQLHITDIAERYFESLRAPSKELLWFERSAHMPNSEERDLFNRLMVEKVLPIACRNAGGFATRAAGLPVPAHLALTPALALAFPAFLLAAAGEELGYTGYVTDLLQQRVANTGRTAFPGGRAAFELDNGAIGYAIVVCFAVVFALLLARQTWRAPSPLARPIEPSQ